MRQRKIVIPKRTEPVVQTSFFGASAKSFRGRELAERLARQGLVAKSRIKRVPRKHLMSKTVSPVIEIGELIEALSAQGFNSAKFIAFLTKPARAKKIGKRTDINAARFVKFAIRWYFPYWKDAAKVAEVKPLLESLLRFVDAQLNAKYWRKDFAPDYKLASEAKGMDARLKKMGTS